MMARIDDLPPELLLNVALWLGNLCHPARTRNRNLCNLSLTARNYRGVSQEILHQIITIQPPKVLVLDTGATVLSPTGPSRIAKLVRTLIERPDLAKKVRHLELVVVYGGPRVCSPSGNCSALHLCGWDEIASLCKRHYTRNCPWLSPQLLSRFRERIDLGGLYQDHIYAGVLLSCVPKLEEWHLVSYVWKDDRFLLGHKRVQTDSPIESCCSSDFLSMSDYFQGRALFLSRSLPSDVPGLTAVKRVSVNGLAPWNLVTLPKLQSLHCILHNTDSLDFTMSSFLRQRVMPFPGAAPSQITDLSMEIAISVLIPRQLAPYNRLGYLHRDLFPNLPLLKRLSIRLVTRTSQSSDELYDTNEMDFEYLTFLIAANNLETLVIDTAEVCYEDLESANTLRNIQFAPSLVHLPKLRRLVSPQELFFSVDSTFNKCSLPPSIESIEFLDSTVALKRYAKYICESKGSLPNLQRFIGWYHRNESHLVQDYRLKYPFRPGVQGSSVSSWIDDWEVNDSVWSQLGSMDVEVEWIQGPNQAWRAM